MRTEMLDEVAEYSKERQTVLNKWFEKVLREAYFRDSIPTQRTKPNKERNRKRLKTRQKQIKQSKKANRK